MGSWKDNARPLKDVNAYRLRNFSGAELSQIIELVSTQCSSSTLLQLEKRYKCFSESFVYALADSRPELLENTTFKVSADLDASADELAAALMFVHTLARLRSNAWFYAIGTEKTPPIRALQIFNGMPVTRGFLYGPLEFMKAAFEYWFSDMHCIVGIEPFSYILNPEQDDTSMRVWSELRENVETSSIGVDELTELLQFYEDKNLAIQQLSPAAYTAFSVGQHDTSAF